jgi:hypothetical protein
MANTDLHIKLLIDADGKASVTEVGKVRQAVAGLGQEAIQVQSPLGGLSAKILALGAGAVGAATTLQSWISASAEAARAEALLQAALVDTGRATQVEVDGLKALATALQDQTGYSGDATVQAQAYLATFGLTAAEIAKLTPSLLDASEAQRKMGATGVDLQGVAKAIGKGYSQSSAALREYGVALTASQVAQIDAATGVAKTDLIVKALNRSFGGLAVAVGSTYDGAARKASEANGDLAEAMGDLVTKSSTVVAGMEAFANANRTAAQFVSEHAAGLRVLFAAGGAAGLAAGFAAITVRIKEWIQGQVAAVAATRAAAAAERERLTAAVAAAAAEQQASVAAVAAATRRLDAAGKAVTAAEEELAAAKEVSLYGEQRAAMERRVTAAKAEQTAAQGALTAATEGGTLAVARHAQAVEAAAAKISVFSRVAGFLGGPLGILSVAAAAALAFASSESKAADSADDLNRALEDQRRKIDLLGRAGLSALIAQQEEYQGQVRRTVSELQAQVTMATSAAAAAGKLPALAAYWDGKRAEAAAALEIRLQELAASEAAVADARARLGVLGPDLTLEEARRARAAEDTLKALAATKTAQEAATGAVQTYIGAQTTATQTAAARAKALGDEAAALAAARTEAELGVQARRVELQATEQAIARTREELAARQASGVARKEELDALGGTLAGLVAERTARQAAVAAAQQETEAARLAALTYGDQSKELSALIARRASLEQSIRTVAAASVEAAPLVAELAKVEKSLFEFKDPAKNQAAYQALVQQQQALKQAIAQTTAELPAAKALMAEVAVTTQRIADAARDAAAAAEREGQAIARTSALAAARADVQIAEIARKRDLAVAEGDHSAAINLTAEIYRKEMLAARAAAEAKREQAATLEKQAKAMEMAAKADGVYTAAEREQVDAARAAAEMAKIEADRIGVAARSKRDALEATRALANQQRVLAEEFAQAGAAGVRTMDDVRQAIAQAAGGTEIEQLGRALEDAFAKGVLSAEEYQQALDDVREKTQQLKAESSTSGKSFNVDFEQVFKQFGADIGRFEKSVDTPLNPTYSQGLAAAYKKWLAEQGAYGEKPASQATTAADYFAARRDQEAKKQDAQTTAQSPTKTVRIELTLAGKTVALDVASGQETALLDALRKAQMAA